MKSETIWDYFFLTFHFESTRGPEQSRTTNLSLALLSFSRLEYSIYNPDIPVELPFPGPQQCDGEKKFLIVGKIRADYEEVGLYL